MPSFRTKRGTCTLEDGALTVESSVRGQFQRYREGNQLLFVSMVVTGVVAIGTPLAAILTRDWRGLVLFAGVAGALVVVGRGSNYVRGFTSESEIPLDAIVEVRAIEGQKGLTRPRFVVVYHSDGDRKKRYVMMPSLWLSYGKREFERAREQFRAAGLTVTE